jgi:MtN3 and saliva related transmembrane protein
LYWQEVLGFIAGASTTVGFLPQVWRLFKLKSAREISLPFTILLLVGMSCWLAYGVFLSLLSVVVWNAVSLVLAVGMLYAKLRWGR